MPLPVTTPSPEAVREGGKREMGGLGHQQQQTALALSGLALFPSSLRQRSLGCLCTRPACPGAPLPTEDLLLSHAKVGAAVLHKRARLAEAARIEQHLQPLPRRQLALQRARCSVRRIYFCACCSSQHGGDRGHTHGERQRATEASTAARRMPCE